MTEPSQRFYRDLTQGDQGDDVARAQRFLIELGYSISEEEQQQKRYGQSMADATARLQNDIASNPFAWIKAFIQSLLTGNSDSFTALTQVSAEDLEEEIIDTQGRASGGRYRVGAGAEDGLGTGRATRVSRTEQRDTAALGALSEGLTAGTGTERAAELAQRFIGQRESGRNGGALVRMANGYTGDPWCGGFVHYLFGQTVPGLYDQANFRSARSFMQEGVEYNAFRPRGSSYQPQVGDAIVFRRTGDPAKGHVGIVTGYDAATRELRYVSGNDGDAVRERTIDLDTPPTRLLGFTDSHALAQAKSIDLGAAVSPQSVLQTQVRPATPVRPPVPTVQRAVQEIAEKPLQTAHKAADEAVRNVKHTVHSAVVAVAHNIDHARDNIAAQLARISIPGFGRNA